MLKRPLDQIFQEELSEDEILLAVEYLQQVSQFIHLTPKVRLQIPTPAFPAPCLRSPPSAS